MKRSLIVFGTISCLLSAPASAVLIFSSTVDRRLVSFDSADPATLLSDVPISGLADQFESVQGIDFRPATGELFALGNAPGGVFRLYTLNTVTGAATRIGSTDFAWTGNSIGFDFNPTVDRIRVVTDSGVSARLHPGTGVLVANDTNLNFGGDNASGISAAAYDRNDIDPGTATTLFGINVTTDQLIRIGGVDGVPTPNAGVVSNIGPLGVDAQFANFDIYTSTAFASLSTTTGNATATLYIINLATGEATSVGGVGNGRTGLTGLAAIPEPGSVALLGLAGLVLSVRQRRNR